MGKRGYNGKTVDKKKKVNSAINYAVNVRLKGKRGDWSLIYPFLLLRFITKIHYIAFGLECSLDVSLLVAQLNYKSDDPSTDG